MAKHGDVDRNGEGADLRRLCIVAGPAALGNAFATSGPPLVHLDLKMANIDATVLSWLCYHLQRSPGTQRSLVSLNLSDNPIGTYGLPWTGGEVYIAELLAHCSALTRLDLQNCHLADLSPVTDELQRAGTPCCLLELNIINNPGLRKKNPAAAVDGLVSLLEGHVSGKACALQVLWVDTHVWEARLNQALAHERCQLRKLLIADMTLDWEHYGPLLQSLRSRCASGKEMEQQELYSLNKSIYGLRREPLHYTEIEDLRIVPPRKDQSVGNIKMHHMGMCSTFRLYRTALPPRRASRYLRVPSTLAIEIVTTLRSPVYAVRVSARNQPATTHPLCNMYSANFVVVVYAGFLRTSFRISMMPIRQTTRLESTTMGCPSTFQKTGTKMEARRILCWHLPKNLHP